MPRLTNAGKLALAAILMVFAVGCGYHASGGSNPNFAPSLQTVAIPVFINQTRTYRVEQVLTAAVVREFQSRTHFRIVTGAADATLTGTVVNTQLSPLTYDSSTGRASSSLVTVNLKVSLVDHNGKVLFENQNYLFHEPYEVLQDLSSFFEEESPAVERLANDFARALVSDISEGF